MLWEKEETTGSSAMLRIKQLATEGEVMCSGAIIIFIADKSTATIKSL